MKALVFENIGKMALKDIPEPKITESNQVLIKVAACGVCGTDIKILQGTHAYKENTVLGHEFNGTVVEAGSSVWSLKKGDRVAIDNSVRCGICDYCRTGASPQCEWLKTKSIGIFVNGGYAEYTLAPESACYKIPDSMDDITASQVETLGTVLNGMNTVQMQPWDSVVILGFGPIGYLFAAMAKNIAARVLVTEIDPFRIGVAKELGVTVLNPNECDLEKEITAWSGGNKADIVIDAVGTQLQNAVQYVTAGGKILAFGMDDSSQAVLKPYMITRKAIKILGTYVGQNTCVPAIKMLQSGKLNMGPFFTKVVPIEQGVAAFSMLGLDLKTMQPIPKQAMKLVVKPA